MRKLIPAIAAAFACALVALPATARAQEAAAPDMASYIAISELAVAPAHQTRFMETVTKLKEAAVASDLSADYRWDVYQKDNTFYVVSWRENMAAFDDEDAFVQAFAGTPGEAMMQEAMEAFAGMDYTASMEVSTYLPDWAYTPEDPAVQPGQHGGVWTVSNWVKPGEADAFAENTKAVMAMLGEIGYRYPIIAHRVMMGDQRVTLVIPFDDLSSFYGEHSVYAHLAQHEKLEAWEDLMEARRQLIHKSESLTGGYLSELSYRPDLQMASAGGRD